MTHETAIDELLKLAKSCGACDGKDKCFKEKAYDILQEFAEWFMDSECDNCEQRMPDEPLINEGHL